MRLEKLEVHGFKSFADKTEFIFQPGLTAFVGPNGCGKSNVVDAVRWVLGEQSVKALRGNEMQDVIFNGSPTRRSLGYAEGSLTLSNTKGLLPTDYEMVSVTRRLYRSGESEYYLNKQRCRLRDIRDLFMDTGIGMDAYSFIEQGKVDVLLISNKQDRRAIFEEAAGISKYKSQKKICLAKLERVDNNLLRLSDIIDEVEKQMRSVKYQAAKARRWKKLEEEKGDLAIALALHQYNGLIKERDGAAGQLDALNAEVGGLYAAIERMEAELSGLETSVIEADQKIAALQAEDAQISSQLQAAEEAVHMNEQRVSELDDLEEATKAEIAKTEAALELMRSELSGVTTEAGELEKAVAAGQAELSVRRAAITDIEKKLRTVRAGIDDLRVRAVDLASERAKHNNELSAIAAQKGQLVRQDERLAERAAERRRNVAECNEQRQGLDARNKDVTALAASLEQERHTAGQELEQVERRLVELSDQANSKRAEIASADSRAELLRDLEEKQEGVSNGVKYLLEARSGENPNLAGICGVIADAIEVDIGHAAAIEAALGPHEQLVVTESFGAMTISIEFLARSGKGKASFLPLDVIGNGNGTPLDSCDSQFAESGIVGRAVDLVRCSEQFGKALRHLIGDVLVVRDIDTAKHLAAADGRAARYATLDGQLLDPRGVSVGGAASSVPGVISRRSELRALEVRRAGLEADLAVLEKQRDESTVLAAATKQKIRELAARIANAQREQADVRAELGKQEMFIKRLESELAASESERVEIKSNIEILARREGEVRDEAARIERSESELRAALAEQETQLRESEAKRDQVRTEATELEVAQAQRLEKAENLRRRTGELGRLISEREKGLGAAREQVGQCARRRREATLAASAKRAEIDRLLDRRGKLGLERAEAGNQRELVRVQFDSRREERTAAGRRVKDAEAQLNKLTVHAAEIAMRIENLESRSVSEYDCSLADRRGRSEAPELDWDKVALEIETIDQKMRSMGAVNTYAIEELEQLERRSVELTNQRDDLRKAEQTLREIIRKINRRSRDLFQKTFDDVRENFQGIFRKLFGGGRADIVLEAEVDILDAGIEIIACPPGKEPASISLLSGGEKAMTAVALLFAIFRSKPSPFCILDEVDAALDEANIERFCMLVREFLRDSQFLVITHSRRTMSMADVLYGITMQEAGVSTKVSVKFEDQDQVAAAG